MDQVWEFHFDGTFTPCDPEVSREVKHLYEEGAGIFEPHGFEEEAVFTRGGGYDEGSGATEAKLWTNRILKVWLFDLWGAGFVVCRDLPSFLEFVRRYESFLRIGVLQEIRELARKIEQRVRN